MSARIIIFKHPDHPNGVAGIVAANKGITAIGPVIKVVRGNKTEIKHAKKIVEPVLTIIAAKKSYISKIGPESIYTKWVRTHYLVQTMPQEQKLKLSNQLTKDPRTRELLRDLF